MRLEIRRLKPDERELIREVVRRAVRLWPNAHLGDVTPREDIRGAFRMIRAVTMQTGDVRQGAYHLERDVDRYEDM